MEKETLSQSKFIKLGEIFATPTTRANFLNIQKVSVSPWEKEK